MERRLAAILAADVVGYSRLMGVDEAGTLQAFKAVRAGVIDPKIAQHRGRVFKTTGDGLLAEFASVVDAVASAVGIQSALREEGGRITMRIGVNVGDVIVDEGDVFGDGVNVAARLESAAPAGGVLISGTAREQLGNKLELQFDDLGDQTLKNIDRPVRAYLVITGPGEGRIGQMTASDKPSIALLPFTNMSGDPEQEFLADGITENVITGLSRFRDLFVIASNSTFAYKGKATNIQDASRELGVRYILEGSVQRSKDRVRITAQLIDGKTGRHLWAERYDRGMDDIFAVQDDVTERIIGSLATAYGGRLLKAWQERPEGTGTRNFQALDYFIRGMEALNRFTRDDNLRARELFGKASQLDPKFGKSIAKIAWSYMIDMTSGWSDNPDRSLEQGLKYARLAIERDDAEAWGYYALAGYHLYRHQFERSIGEFRRALELNPNDPDVLTDFGYCLSYAGQSTEALDAALKAMQLNPHYPEWYMLQLGMLYFDARQYRDAVKSFESLRTLDTALMHLYLGASHAALGNAENAQKAIRHVLELDPAATVSKWTATEIAPYKNPSDLDHFREHLRKAGLPE